MTKATLSDYLYCALLSLPWLSIQSIWQTEFGTVRDTMIAYGLPIESAGIIWVFGPITGFFTAPLIGAWSDNCTSKWGRRRPFIILGLLSTIISGMTFALASKFGSAKVVVGYISFVLLDVTINVMQTPVRALASDLAPAHMQNTVQLMAAMFQGLGSVMGFYLQEAIQGKTGGVGALPNLIGVVMAINLVIVSIVVMFVKEPQFVQREGVQKKSILEPFTSVFRNVVRMDAKVAIVCAIEFCSWWALFFWWTASSVWWKLTVYQGCLAVGDGVDPNCLPDSPAAQRAAAGGADYASTGIYANLIQIVVSGLLSLVVLSGLIKRVKFIYSAGLAIGGALMILLKFGPRDVWFAWLVTLSLPLAIAVIQAFPFAIVGSYNKGKDGEETGVQMGMLNLFICLPQFLVTVINNGIKIDDTTSLFISGVALSMGAVLALFIKEVDPEDEALVEMNKTKA